MLFLPEIRLQRLCASLFAYLVNNYKVYLERGEVQNSHLFLLFHHDSDKDSKGEDNLFNQAVEIFTRNSSDPRALLVRPIFDRERANLPTVHISIPQEVPNMQFLGDASGENYSNGLVKLESGYEAAFTYLITSDNILEVNIITYVLRSLLLSTSETLSSLGFNNPKFTTQEISLESEAVPAGIYVKGISMSSVYLEKVPQINLADQLGIVNNVFFIKDCTKSCPFI